jgi:superfamily I DNA/RNA helicase
MVPTIQQQTIFDFIGGNRKFRDTETGNISVDAVAGSGKTTTAVASIPYAAKRFGRIGFTAFSKEIATTLQAKVQGKCTAGTMHSMGLKMVTEKFGRLPLEDWKYLEICKREFPSWHEIGKRGFRRLKIEYASFNALTRIVREQNVSVQTVTDDLVKKISWIAGSQGVSLPKKEIIPELIGGVFRCLEIGSDNPSTIDFCDMIWLPVHLGLGHNIFDLMYADEAQDFNPLQQQWMLNVAPTKVIIGDPFQSIMGFAGADSNSFKNMTKWLGARQLPLSVCWRCPTSHLDLARYLVPHIEASPSAIEGEVNRVERAEVIRKAKPKDMIICRANAPLLQVAYNLLQSGKKCIVRGKAIGQGIVTLIERLDPSSISDLNLKVLKWKEGEVTKLLDRDARQEAYDVLYDQVDCILEMSKNYATPSDFIRGAKELFADDKETREDQVVLSSVHRAKGLECDNVTILQPSKLGAWGESEEDYAQEKNLLYVALTRSKNVLNICGSTGAEGGLRSWVRTIASQKVAPPRMKGFNNNVR